MTNLRDQLIGLSGTVQALQADVANAEEGQEVTAMALEWEMEIAASLRNLLDKDAQVSLGATHC